MTSETNFQNKTILWWGRFKPNYSRNIVLRDNMRRLGFRIVDFHPSISQLGDLEAALKQLPTPDFVWVPCFRQRDIAAAARWAKRRHVPVVFDPLISSFQKRLYEQQRFQPGSRRAKQALNQERRLFAQADHVVADTVAHRDFYRDTLNVPAEKLSVIYVGASDDFQPAPLKAKPDGAPLDILFYGSFLPLHGIPTILEAARLARQDATLRWTILGDGPEKEACLKSTRDLPHLQFEKPIPYEKLCARIHDADIVLGVFGETAQASRVIPNKVFQALAAGRPVITRQSSAYPPDCVQSPALTFVPPANPDALLKAVHRLGDPSCRRDAANQARPLFNSAFSPEVLQHQLKKSLCSLPLHKPVLDSNKPENNPTVSIIVPVYNTASYLARCLISILSQTYQNLEIICVNDASTDSSADILSDFAQQDSRIRIITHKTNQGLSAARNTGLDQMTGTYLTFVDSDDYIPPYAIETFLRVANESGQPVVISRTCSLNHLPKMRNHFRRWYLEKTPHHALLSAKRYQYSAWNKFFHAKVFSGHRFIKGITYEDVPLITCLLGDLNAIACLNEPLYVYCQNEGSITQTSFSKKKAESFIIGIQHILSHFAGSPADRTAQKIAAVFAAKLIKKVYKTQSQELTSYFLKLWKDHQFDQLLRPSLSLKTRYRLFKLQTLAGAADPSIPSTNT